MKTPISILLVEDQPMWQQALTQLLAPCPQFRLVGIAEDFETGWKQFQRQQPQLILLDWKILGEKDGLALGHQLLQAGVPPERVIVISGSPANAIPPHPFLYVPKNRIADELLPLLESVTKD